ncbi:MAG: CocE/NonD family hydrolase [Treponema sp.]|nr:CocE/NonD family hydrolase [Treponema sp.]
MAELFTKKRKFGDVELEVVYRKARIPVDVTEKRDMNQMEAHGLSAPFNQRVYEVEPGILCEQDIPVKLRDGITIYCDIYRPRELTGIPALVSWSFYGKRPGESLSEWQIMGVPPGTVSEMSKFESPDPGFWCRHGYAVVNVDSRGAGRSGGDATVMDKQDGEDGYDFIEWLAAQWWCSGKVGLGGNSAVAMTQWRIAAECPPHLACVAPWEGSGDIYRQSLYEGGIPALSFNEFVVSSVTGLGGIDDVVENAKKYPFFNEYWAAKIPKYENIKIPVYATACWNHFHLPGSFEGFRKTKSTRKWMRAHRDFEWPDAYNPENLEDLKRFYDRYLKDIHNGWEFTPRFRLEVEDAYEFNYQHNRPEEAFPLKRTEYKKLFLDASNNTLSRDPVSKEGSVSYDAQTGETAFDIQFDEDTEITGYMTLRLWVEAKGHNEMDLFVNIQKLSTSGEWIPVSVLGEPHPGAWGKMRVSRRALDEKQSKSWLPVQSHLKDEKLSPGQIVPVDIAIVPSSRFWHKGQSLRVQIAGRYIREGWFEPLSWETDNKGAHIIYAGGKYDSHLSIPYIPPKYKDGDIEYR